MVGTIDTEYVAETNDQGTEVCDVTGTTQVQSSNPNIAGSVILQPGQCTWVAFGAAPTAPVANPGMLSSLLNLTNITGTLGALGAAGAGGAAAGAGFPWVWVGVGVAAAAAAGISAAVVTSGPSNTSPTQ